MPVPELMLTPVDHNPFIDDATAAAFPETVGNPGIDAAVRGIAGGIKDFVTTPGTLANTPNPYPPGSEENIEFERTRQQAGDNWARNAALATMGTGAVAGLPVNAGEAVLGAGPIRAYHGSPHDFDAFSLDKIGTGEGAQAYGHGLYFAGNEKVAQGYRDALAKDMYYTPSGEMFDPQSQLQHLNVRVAARNNGPDLDATIARAQELLPKASEQTRPMLEKDLATLQRFKDAGGISKNPGKMYEVQINADPEHFLDWDKPLSEQHPKVQATMQPFLQDQLGRVDKLPWSPLEKNDLRDRLASGDMSGAELYRAQFGHGNSEALREAGIPGIKYLDQGSRASGEGSRNYVVFDDKLIDIIRKYGMAGLSMLPPATAAYLTQRIMPVDHDPFEQGAGVLKPVDHDPFAAQL